MAANAPHRGGPQPQPRLMTRGARAVPGLAAHPAARLLAGGLTITISTDTRTTSATTLTREFAELRASAGWTTVQEELVQAHAAGAAFAPWR
ncbi:hypothetical protein [Nonomuraea solani]|uniref:hypothetical protein n=1 Tax=Nonomuraea solani TaxID=1144553 RepID=UPI001F21C33E|nr:hypothetical protein [Nonomuraea solani]